MSLEFSPVGQSGMKCEVRSPLGYKLVVSGTLDDIEPAVEGDAQLTGNPALIHNAWAYARHEKMARRLKDPKKCKSHRDQAEAHQKAVEEIAPLAEALSDIVRDGWCSGCFTLAQHRRVELKGLRVPAYLCGECGTPSLVCAAPRCQYMAVRKSGSVRVPRYCAEHRHDIPSFENATAKVDDIADYQSLFEYDERNLARIAKVATGIGLGAGVIATGGVLSAPAIGGAIGSMAGFSGAAASSYGLAMLGGGSIAAGGFGMVGGTYVVAAAGAALGGAMGSMVTNSYVGEDKSFKIAKFRNGTGTPVIVVRGFLTETAREWSQAMAMVEARYPDSPIYRLHWGSKELKAMAGFVGINGGAGGGAVGLAAAGARASKSAASKIPGVGAAMVAAGVLSNPWHTALVRADRTGVALAGLIARTNVDRYILVGHSLGARVVLTAAETLALSPDVPKIETLHVMGAAKGKKGDWRRLNEAVVDKVCNYYSSNDKVLKFAFQGAQFGSKPMGLYGIESPFPKIKDYDVSKTVGGHSQYFSNVKLK